MRVLDVADDLCFCNFLTFAFVICFFDVISEHFRPFPIIILNFGLYHFASRPFNYSFHMNPTNPYNLQFYHSLYSM